METELGKRYGLVNLPQHIKTFTVDFEMGLVEHVHEADRAMFMLIIEYIAYHVAQARPDLGMRTLVGQDPDDALAVVYQLQCDLPLATEMSDEHCDMIKALCPIGCIRDPIRWSVDQERMRVLLMVPIRSVLSRALQIRDMDFIRIRARLNKQVVYESDGRSASVKRNRLDKDK